MDTITRLCTLNAALDRQLALNDLLLLCLKDQFLRLRMLTKEVQILENHSPFPFEAGEWEIESEFGILPFQCRPFSQMRIEWGEEPSKKVTLKCRNIAIPVEMNMFDASVPLRYIEGEKRREMKSVPFSLAEAKAKGIQVLWKGEREIGCFQGKVFWELLKEGRDGIVFSRIESASSMEP